MTTKFPRKFDVAPTPKTIAVDIIDSQRYRSELDKYQAAIRELLALLDEANAEIERLRSVDGETQ